LSDYNGILVNKISNLVNRVFSMNGKYFASKLPASKITTSVTQETNERLLQMEMQIFSVMKTYDFNKYLDVVVKYSEELNQYIDLTTP